MNEVIRIMYICHLGNIRKTIIPIHFRNVYYNKINEIFKIGAGLGLLNALYYYKMSISMDIGRQIRDFMEKYKIGVNND